MWGIYVIFDVKYRQKEDYFSWIFTDLKVTLTERIVEAQLSVLDNLGQGHPASHVWRHWRVAGVLTVLHRGGE